MNSCRVSFPRLGITIDSLPSSFSVFGLGIAFYGLIIAIAMAAGYMIAAWQAKRTDQDPDVYLDFAIWAVIISVICGRLYYVIFSWDMYKSNLLQIFNLRAGGMAIYGAVIGAIATAIVYTRIKKMDFWILADTGCVGLVTGQIIGRWGNFFNKEAFGGYSDGLFSMALPWEEAKMHMSAESMEKLLPHVVDGIITVHPTFLYESLWNLVILIIILVYTKHKKFDGELFFIYLGGYGLGRLWIEGLRTDQLLLWNTRIPVSQLLAGIMFLISLTAIIIGRKQNGFGKAVSKDVLKEKSE